MINSFESCGVPLTSSFKETNALTAKMVRKLKFGVELGKGNTLSGQFICGPDHCGFGHALVQEESSLNFGSTQTMTRDVDNIINTATDPIKSFMISSSAITRKLKSEKIFQNGIKYIVTRIRF